MSISYEAQLRLLHTQILKAFQILRIGEKNLKGRVSATYEEYCQ